MLAHGDVRCADGRLRNGKICEWKELQASRSERSDHRWRVIGSAVVLCPIGQCSQLIGIDEKGDASGILPLAFFERSYQNMLPAKRKVDPGILIFVQLCTQVVRKWTSKGA